MAITWNISRVVKVKPSYVLRITYIIAFLMSPLNELYFVSRKLTAVVTFSTIINSITILFSIVIITVKVTVIYCA